MEKSVLFLTTIVLMFSTFFAFSQNSTNENSIYVKVDKFPAFQNGDTAIDLYICKNIKYPAIARENKIEGKVLTSFVVEIDGSISNVKVIHGIGGGCDEEAKRAIKNLPKLSPGIHNGQPVRVQLNVPLYFKLM
jgi:protein TonB